MYDRLTKTFSLAEELGFPSPTSQTLIRAFVEIQSGAMIRSHCKISSRCWRRRRARLPHAAIRSK